MILVFYYLAFLLFHWRGFQGLGTHVRACERAYATPKLNYFNGHAFDIVFVLAD